MSLGVVFRLDEEEAVLDIVLFIPKAFLFLVFYFVFSRLEEWPHKRFVHRHALELDYSTGYGGHFLRARVSSFVSPFTVHHP